MRRSFTVGAVTGVLLVALATVGYAGTQGGDEPAGSDQGNTVGVDPGTSAEPDPGKAPCESCDQPSATPPAGPPAPEPQPPQSRLVTPRPGMVGVHPVRWERAEQLDAWTVRLHFYSGVEPCYVLDSVKVDYDGHEVRIALFEGTDPTAGNVACIDLAVLKAVDVQLRQPVAGRKIVDAFAR